MLPIMIAVYAVMAGGAAATAFGAWFQSQPEERQQEINRKAGEYARKLYNKALDQLSKVELNHVIKLLKGP